MSQLQIHISNSNNTVWVLRMASTIYWKGLRISYQLPKPIHTNQKLVRWSSWKILRASNVLIEQTVAFHKYCTGFVHRKRKKPLKWVSWILGIKSFSFSARVIMINKSYPKYFKSESQWIYIFRFCKIPIAHFKFYFFFQFAYTRLSIFCVEKSLL